MKAIIQLFFLTLCFAAAATEGKKYSLQEYVDEWKQVAVEQMQHYKIPASITLAQAILESANGNSDLAQGANNHFGIKCSNWTGETYYKDDDQKNECFRKYADAKESYQDHSTFLTGKTRYAALFTYEITDYKSWAQGLKDAGYATNPKYPQLLIDLIERLKLDELDAMNSVHEPVLALVPAAKVEKTEKSSSKALMMANTHEVLKHKNNIKYIVAKKGDTFYRISKEFGMGMWELYKYNDFSEKKDYLVEGDIVFLAPKKRKAKNERQIQVKQEISLRDLSQLEGIKIQRLMKLNNISSPDQLVKKGEKISLK